MASENGGQRPESTRLFWIIVGSVAAGLVTAALTSFATNAWQHDRIQKDVSTAITTFTGRAEQNAGEIKVLRDAVRRLEEEVYERDARRLSDLEQGVAAIEAYVNPAPLRRRYPRTQQQQFTPAPGPQQFTQGAR